MSIIVRRSAAAFAALALSGLLAGDAHAQASGKKKLEGCLLSLDVAAGKMVVKDRQSKKDVDLRIKPGAVLDRTATAVKKDGRGAKLEDLEVNRPLFVYWEADKQNEGGKFASRAEAPDPIDEETGKPDVDLMETFGCELEQ
jgi:hypothetical protein